MMMTTMMMARLTPRLRDPWEGLIAILASDWEGTTMLRGLGFRFRSTCSDWLRSAGLPSGLSPFFLRNEACCVSRLAGMVMGSDWICPLGVAEKTLEVSDSSSGTPKRSFKNRNECWSILILWSLHLPWRSSQDRKRGQRGLCVYLKKKN